MSANVNDKFLPLKTDWNEWKSERTKNGINDVKRVRVE